MRCALESGLDDDLDAQLLGEPALLDAQVALGELEFALARPLRAFAVADMLVERGCLIGCQRGVAAREQQHDVIVETIAAASISITAA